MIAILDYKAGNISSVQNALNRLGVETILTHNPFELEKVDKLIIPGVGEASSAMQDLRKNGLVELIQNFTKPVLGICLGMQLLCEFSEEGNTACLGIFKTRVKKFPAKDIVPHMGWNNFVEIKGALFHSIQPQDDVYFVHSYYAGLCIETIAVTDYILPFSSALQKDNFYGTQFHPEKSDQIGSQILTNFLAL
jgi:glutamine amidotransferase